MVPSFVQFAPYVSMRLTVEEMREEVGIVRSVSAIIINLTNRLAEVVPAVYPLAVFEAFVSLGEFQHQLFIQLALGKRNRDALCVEWVELNTDFICYIELYDQARGPYFGGSFAGKVEVALSVDDMCALVLLVATYAVAVLTENCVSSV